MRTPDTDERGHVTLDVVDPKEVLASLRSADVATTLRLPVLAVAVAAYFVFIGTNAHARTGEGR